MRRASSIYKYTAPPAHRLGSAAQLTLRTSVGEMDATFLATGIATVAALGTAGAAAWGVLYAKRQVDTAAHDRQVDRVLGFHRDLTADEVGAARNRFSELMFRVGEEAFGPGYAWRPSWGSLLPVDPNVQGPARNLGAYPADMTGPGDFRHLPLNDLRAVLWCFERIEEARHREASLDDDLLTALIGYHAAWWNLLCQRLEPTGGGHLSSLISLARWMEEKNWRDDRRNTSRHHPEDDFHGGEDDELLNRLSACQLVVNDEIIDRMTPHESSSRDGRSR